MYCNWRYLFGRIHTFEVFFLCGAHPVKKILQKYEFGQIDIANYNTSSQIVIAGAADEIKRAASFFEKEGAKGIVRDDREIQFRKMKLLDKFRKFTLCTFHETRMKSSIEQITNSVKWTESIRYLMGQGVTVFEEIGPGNILFLFIRSCRIVRDDREIQFRKMKLLDKFRKFTLCTQIVIAGAADEIKRAASFFEKEGAKAYIVLQVGGVYKVLPYS
jgi:malonyl CoA-acyl carrier protein transacylase